MTAGGWKQVREASPCCFSAASSNARGRLRLRHVEAPGIADDVAQRGAVGPPAELVPGAGAAADQPRRIAFAARADHDRDRTAADAPAGVDDLEDGEAGPGAQVAGQALDAAL